MHVNVPLEPKTITGGLKEARERTKVGKGLVPDVEHYQKWYDSVSGEADRSFKAYVEFSKAKALIQLKLIYVKALEEGISLERARGRADENYLTVSELEEKDDEIKRIISLFSRD